VSTIRTFETGATRDALGDKLQYEGYFCPLVLEARARYMRTHQTMADGSLREPDNWQKGIPKDALMDSGFRHFHDWWKEHRGHASREGLVAALCGLMFNAEAYLHAVLAEPAANALRAGERLVIIGPDGPAPEGTPVVHIPIAIAGSDEPAGVYVEPLDEPFPLPAYGPGSPAATTTTGGTVRVYVGEDGDPDRQWAPV
jgi:hypothetical protein